MVIMAILQNIWMKHNVKFLQVTGSLRHRPFRESSIHTACQDISWMLWNLNIHFHFYNNRLLDFTLTQANPIHAHAHSASARRLHIRHFITVELYVTLGFCTLNVPGISLIHKMQLSYIGIIVIIVTTEFTPHFYFYDNNNKRRCFRA